MQMPAYAFQTFVAVLHPPLARRGLSPLCRTAITLRYLGGDGVAMLQDQPWQSDDQCVADHYSRKGSYSFNAQAIRDADYNIRWMNCMSPGATHDSTAFACMRLGRTLMNPTDKPTASLSAAGDCIVADDAYAASEVLAVPWPGGWRGDRWKDGYNFASLPAASTSRRLSVRSLGVAVSFGAPCAYDFRRGRAYFVCVSACTTFVITTCLHGTVLLNHRGKTYLGVTGS